MSGRERRRWIRVGHDRSVAEAVAARLDNKRDASPVSRGSVTVGEFLTRTWMPHKRRHVRATTAYRYAWFIDRYINPAIGGVPLRRLRADHLDGLYEHLATTDGRHATGLAPKTIAPALGRHVGGEVQRRVEALRGCGARTQMERRCGRRALGWRRRRARRG